MDLINLFMVTLSTAIGTKRRTRNKNLRVCAFAIKMRAETLCHLCRHTFPTAEDNEDWKTIPNGIGLQNF